MVTEGHPLEGRYFLLPKIIRHSSWTEIVKRLAKGGSYFSYGSGFEALAEFRRFATTERRCSVPVSGIGAFLFALPVLLRIFPRPALSKPYRA
jgi:hypothetical protein